MIVNLIPLQHNLTQFYCFCAKQQWWVMRSRYLVCHLPSRLFQINLPFFFFAFHVNEMVLNFQNRKKFYFIYEGHI